MRLTIRWLRTAGLAALGFTAAAFAQTTDTLTVKRATELRDAPAETARALTPLPAQTQVNRLGSRQGPWIEVRTAQGQSGWIHMFDAGLPPQPAQGNAASGALRGLTGLLSGGSARPANVTGTSTLGIRGLGAEELANAQPNLDAVAQAEALRMSSAQARGFGAIAQLQPTPVDPLPVPAARPPSATPAGTAVNPGTGTTGGDR